MIREVLSLDRLLAMTPDEAAALLAVRRSDGATTHDAAMLEAWLQADDANARAWARAQAGWRLFDEAHDDELLHEMRRAAVASRPAQAAPLRRMAAAAAVLLVLGGAVLTLVLQTPGQGGKGGTVVATQGATQAYVTGDGQRRTVVLADGSRIVLDGDTRVEVAFSAARRDLRLRQGHAFFDVAHDAARPFAVGAGDRQVVAVGTKFDVRIDPGQMRVVLVEGRVSVAAPGSRTPATLLAAGEQLVARTGQPADVSHADIDAALDWQQGYVTFDDTPLSEVVAILNKAGADIVVRDPAVARLKISGRFQTGDVARFGRTLAQVHPVRLVQIAPHRFEIVARR